MEIATRRERLRLPKKRLAELAKIDEMTVNRALRAGANPTTKTLDRIETALLAEERRLFEHLHKLHGAAAVAA